jgi:hypothetical protein
MDTNALVGRLTRVLRFDASVFREIAADNNAMPQAGIVVTLAALLAAIGQQLQNGVLAVVAVAIIAIIAFFIYTAVATGVSKVLQGKTSFNEMGRTLGYAYAWYALGILALIPFGGGFLAWVGSIVAWVAGIIALRESAEFETWKAVVTVIVAGIVAVVLTVFVTAPILLILGVASGAQ